MFTYRTTIIYNALLYNFKTVQIFGDQALHIPEKAGIQSVHHTCPVIIWC